MKLIQYEEDQVTSASVVEKQGFGRLLYVNEHVVALDVRHDRPSHELVVHVPLLIHPDPKRVCVIGLGIGLSVYASLAHDVEVDVVELSASVVKVNPAFAEGVKEYVAEHGHGVLEDPRVHVRIEDGRNFVLGTREKYDVIQVGGFHPTITSGAAGFYSVDFYRDCQRLLTPDGIFTQWLPAHQIPREDFKTILRSFNQGFPHTSIWFKYTSDFCLLMGSMQPLSLNVTQVEERMSNPAIARHLARCDVSQVWDLLDSFCISGPGIARAVGAGPLQTDRHPTIEYHRFRGKRSDNVNNLRLLARARESVLPFLTGVPEERQAEVAGQLRKWFDATQFLLDGQIRTVDRRPKTFDEYLDNFERAAASYRRAMELNPDDANAVFLWKRSLAGFHWDMARHYLPRGNEAEGYQHLKLAAEISPDTYWGSEAKFILDLAAQGVIIHPR